MSHQNPAGSTSLAPIGENSKYLSSMPDFYHLIKCLPGSSMSLQMTGVIIFWLNNIVLQYTRVCRYLFDTLASQEGILNFIECFFCID
jgi:hypothetical protein